MCITRPFSFDPPTASSPESHVIPRGAKRAEESRDRGATLDAEIPRCARDDVPCETPGHPDTPESMDTAQDLRVECTLCT